VGALGTLNYLLAWGSLDARRESNRSLWSDQAWADAYYSPPPLTSRRSSEIWRQEPYAPRFSATWPDGTSSRTKP
jgi:hypothetical protein